MSDTKPTNATPDDDDDDIGIQDVKVALETVFLGCKPLIKPSMGGSYHAEVTFHEYEIRVILTGERAKGRKMHYRFLQKIPMGDGMKPVKRTIQEFETTDPKELLRGIQESKSHLMSIVYAVTRALKTPSTTRIRSIDDLFNE